MTGVMEEGRKGGAGQKDMRNWKTGEDEGQVCGEGGRGVLGLKE